MSAPALLWMCIALLILVRGGFGVLPSMWGWGLNVQRFLDPVSGWGLWWVAAAALLPAVGKRGSVALESAGDFLVRSPRAHLVAWTVGASLVFLLPDRLWFVGDFVIRQGNVQSGFLAANYVGAMPLDFFLHTTLLRPFGLGSIAAANTTLRALGALEAGLLAAISVSFARTLDARGTRAALASGIVFFGGYLTVFTGLGKPAGEMCLCVAGLATFGIAALRGRRGLLPLGVVMALALLLHRSSVMLVPAWSLIVGLWLRARRGQPGWAGASTWLGLLLPASAAAFALPRIATVAAEYDLSRHVLTAETVRQGGLLASAFSARHLVDLANLVVALSPVAAVIPFAMSRPRPDPSKRPEVLVLALLAASFVPALFLVQPQQGVFRDWDVFAPAGVALSLLAACLVSDALHDRPSHAWLAVPVLALALVSSLQWLLLNRDVDRGLMRVRAYLMEPPGPQPADAPRVWDFLAQRNLTLGRWSDAADAAAHAAELGPHRRILLMWGYAETMKGDHAAAARVYRQLLRRDPADPLGWLGLAGAARRLGDRAELDRAMGMLGTYAPDGVEVRQIRRHLLHFPEAWPGGDPWR